jgi:secreted PhoX family phosphatase
MAKASRQWLASAQPSLNETFVDVFRRRLSCHRFPQGGRARAPLLVLDPWSAVHRSQVAAEEDSTLTFQPISSSDEDCHIIAPGYAATVLTRRGDPFHPEVRSPV